MNILVDSTPFSPPPPNRGGLKGLINPSNLVDCNISCCVLKTELIDVFSCPPFFFSCLTVLKTLYCQLRK